MKGKVRSAFAGAAAVVVLTLAAACDQGPVAGAAETGTAESLPEATETPPGVAPFEVQLDLAGLTSAASWAPANVKATPEGVLLRTHPNGGGYSAMINTGKIGESAVPGRVKVSIEVKSGAVEMWAAKLGDAATRLGEGVVAKAGPPIVVEIPLADASAPITLMFSNGPVVGSSEALISTIQVVGP